MSPRRQSQRAPEDGVGAGVPVGGASRTGGAMTAIYGLALRRGRRERATRRGPWDLPDGWRVRETTICGRP